MNDAAPMIETLPPSRPLRTFEEDRAFRPFCPDMFDIDDPTGFRDAIEEMERNPAWWLTRWMTDQ